MRNGSRAASEGRETIGLDLSDKTGLYVVIDEEAEVVKQGKVSLTQGGIRKVFSARQPCRIAIEVGTHSPWLSRLLAELGYEVIVANPRQVKLISQGPKKTDRQDAETLARLARLDPALLKPIRHRGAQAQADLARLRARDALVKSRTELIGTARGLVKADGGRLPQCSANCFAAKARAAVAKEFLPVIAPLLAIIAGLSLKLKEIKRELEKLARERYPESAIFRQVSGVGLLTSLRYLLTLEERGRFRRSREVGAYLGLTTRQRQSGEDNPQLHITKAGDVQLRTALVQCAHYILGPFGKDSDLRRWGLGLAGQGNKSRKKKAVIAVARKLSVLLHSLWVSGEVYAPLRQAEALTAAEDLSRLSLSIK